MGFENLPERWKLDKLINLTSKIGSGATPKGGSDVYKPSGEIALIRSQNVYNLMFQKEGLAYIGQHHADKLSNVDIQENDVLLNITGDSVARACIVPKAYIPARVNQHVAIIRTVENKLNSRYLQYFLVSPNMQAHMLSLSAAGATRKALTKGMIEGFDIPLPPLPQQEKIASILGALDDKIELNNRMNKTLEAMAKALFKSWFVDFEPFRRENRKADDNCLSSVGSEPEVMGESPTDGDFVDSELGMIPKGWRVGKLSDIAEIIMGQSPKGSSYNESEEGTPLINGASDFDGTLPKPKKYTTEPTKISSDEDIVFGVRATIGNVVFLSGGYCLGRGVAAVRTKFPYLRFAYLSMHNEIDAMASNASGSVFANLTKADISGLKLVIPPEEVLQSFEKIAQPLLSQRRLNDESSSTLSTQRDALLPKLMNGEINIKD